MASSGAGKTSDLPTRLGSAAVMVAVSALAFTFGGLALDLFVIAVCLGVFAEWTMLVFAFERRLVLRAVWLLVGVGYIGLACRTALAPVMHTLQLLEVVGSVIAVDVGAYFAGRGFGGPRIAPAISPSKTWSGLGGAIVAATVYFLALASYDYEQHVQFLQKYAARSHHDVSHAHIRAHWLDALIFGVLTALVAQAGDFFESWMKRRAGVKDSGRMIPGHGGLFDRADGLIAVLFAIGIRLAVWSI
jgi:phosphatidate cytidylyltransferase